jgi:Na+-translocating ferredoxin:NAD+ oxidoreductase subunit B
VTADAGLADLIDAALPQTQCTRCGYPDCRHYASAIAEDGAAINQCPPGGQEGVARLARITRRPVLPLNPAHGVEGPLRVARVEESDCIGCTRCLDACPVDCIIGAPKVMHVVAAAQCTGCELCLPACPVDCITLHTVHADRTGWMAWSAEQAAQARSRYAFHALRVERDQAERNRTLAARSRPPNVAAEQDAAAPQRTGPTSTARRSPVLAAGLDGGHPNGSQAAFAPTIS